MEVLKEMKLPLIWGGQQIYIVSVFINGSYPMTNDPIYYVGIELEEDMAALEISVNMPEWLHKKDEFFCRTDQRYGLIEIINELKKQNIISCYGDGFATSTRWANKAKVL